MCAILISRTACPPGRALARALLTCLAAGAGCKPGSAAEAVRAAVDALGWLAGVDMASVPVAVQADCLRELERAALGPYRRPRSRADRVRRRRRVRR